MPWPTGLIIRIDPPPPAIVPSLLQLAAGRREPRDFGVDDPPAASPPSAPVTPPTTSVEMLVALASIDPAVERRRKLAAEADRGLALLERLHEESLGGGVMPERLEQLSAWVAGFAIPDDPELASVARDIELRVRVELAKHDLTA